MNIQLRAKISSYISESELPARTFWGQIEGQLNNQTDLSTILTNIDSNISNNTAEIQTLQSDILELGASKADSSTLSSHILNNDNPHNTTKEQIGLGYVDNTSDMNKPISEPTQAALSNKQDTLVAGNNISIQDNIISAVAATATWGDITGELNAQTDLHNALNSKLTKVVSGDTTRLYAVSENNEQVMLPTTIFNTYDLVVRTQSEFDDFCSSLDNNSCQATSVLLIGTFIRNTGNGLTLPSTLKLIQGHNAVIEVSGLNTTENEAIIGAGDKSQKLVGLTVKVVNSTYGSAFYNCYNMEDCLCEAIDTSPSVGYRGCLNLTNCRATIRGAGAGSGIGFYQCTRLVNCESTVSGNENEQAAFAQCSQLSNCQGSVDSNNGVVFTYCSYGSSCIALQGIATTNVTKWDSNSCDITE